MKQAIEWLNELGKVVSEDMFIPKNPPGDKVVVLIKKIQDDARQELLDEISNLEMKILEDGERE